MRQIMPNPKDEEEEDEEDEEEAFTLRSLVKTNVLFLRILRTFKILSRSFI